MAAVVCLEGAARLQKEFGAQVAMGGGIGLKDGATLTLSSTRLKFWSTPEVLEAERAKVSAPAR